MSISRKLVRDKIRKAHGNKAMSTFWELYKKADTKNRLDMIKQFENKKDIKPKNNRKRFEIKYIELKTKIKKSIIIFANDKKQAKEKVKNMFMSENRITRKINKLIKIKSIKEIK